MKRDKRLIFFGSSLALLLLLVAYQFKQRELSRPLPPTPQEGFKRMIISLRATDINGLSQIMSPRMMKTFEAYQGKDANVIYVYDYLTSKGIKPTILQQPWGLWNEWAKQVDLKKTRARLYGKSEMIVTSGNPNDYLTFYYEKRSTGWLCTKIITAVGSGWKGEAAP